MEYGFSTYQGIDEFLEGPVVSGLHSIRTNNHWFDFLYSDRGSPVTLVAFSAALPDSWATYPRFSSVALAEKVGANYLGFADAVQPKSPTFWHLGSEWVNSQRKIPAIISKVSASDGERHLLFFGSSAGGFAALNYSAHFPGSAALVMNPRVNLMHAPRWYREYAAVAHPSVDRTVVAKSLPFDQAEAYRRARGNFVVYLQNLQDPNFYRHHYLHFYNATRGRSDVRFILGEWGEGHVVPPRPIFLGALAALVEAAPTWNLAEMSDLPRSDGALQNSQ